MSVRGQYGQNGVDFMRDLTKGNGNCVMLTQYLCLILCKGVRVYLKVVVLQMKRAERNEKIVSVQLLGMVVIVFKRSP